MIKEYNENNSKNNHIFILNPNKYITQIIKSIYRCSSNKSKKVSQ